MIKLFKKIFDLEKNKIQCKHCQAIIDYDYVFCPQCHQTTENYGKSIDYKKKFIQVIILYGVLFVIGYGFFVVNRNNKSKLTGLYYDSFNNRIELKSNGTIQYNQLVANSLSCHTTGNWSKLDSNHIKISLNINSNCSFISRYSGKWEIKNCLKYGKKEPGCLVKDNKIFFIKSKVFNKKQKTKTK